MGEARRQPARRSLGARVVNATTRNCGIDRADEVAEDDAARELAPASRTDMRPADVANAPAIYSGGGAVITVFPELPGWRFSVKRAGAEVAAYEVFGVHPDGRRVLARAPDATVALDACRCAAARLVPDAGIEADAAPAHGKTASGTSSPP